MRSSHNRGRVEMVVHAEFDQLQVLFDFGKWLGNGDRSAARPPEHKGFGAASGEGPVKQISNGPRAIHWFASSFRSAFRLG
jgi:hypothetical protein